MKRVLTLLAVVGCALCAGAAKTETVVVTPQTRLRLHLVRNGGWCAVIE